MIGASDRICANGGGCELRLDRRNPQDCGDPGYGSTALIQEVKDR